MNETNDENAPLVQSHQIQVGSENPADVHELEYSVQGEEPPPYSSYEEKLSKPPPYYHPGQSTPSLSEGSSAGSSLIPHINCRVCQTILSVEGKLHLHVIKCHSCGEATPIRPAPTGKKYVRCPCNCLLICKATSQRIVCPRPNCKRVISLGPVSITSLHPDGERRSQNPTRRFVCAHCNTSFLWVHPGDAYDACPHCNRYSSFGPGYKKRRMKLFAIITVIMLILAGSVTLLIIHYSSMPSTHWSHWYYVIFSVLYLLSLITMLHTLRISCISVSKIERSYLQYT